MKNNQVTCEEMALKIMALIDNELDDKLINQVQEHNPSTPTATFAAWDST